MRVTGARISLVALASVLLGGAPAAALAVQPTPNSSGAAVPPAVKGTSVCTVTDKNAVEISGLVLSNGVLYALNDSTSTAARQKVFKMNPATCAVTGTPLGYPAQPRDPEDLAVDAQGTIWIGDIGDNTSVRPNVAVWKLANDKITGPLRMSYPDGKKYDAEALLVGSDGLPIIITKGEGLLFVPTGPLQENSTSGVPMKQVGKVTLPKTSTDNPLSAPGRSMITGAATATDRSKVVLRTYADAFEFAVADGDIVKAITTGKPKITPLPMEPWGEAIVYGADGKFLTMSDVGQLDNVKAELLSYAPNNEDPNPPTPAAQIQQPPSGDGKAWWSSLISSTSRLYMLIGSIGIFGLLLVLLGILGIKRSRTRRRDEEEEEDFDPRAARGRRNDGYADDGYYEQPGYGYQEPGYGYQDQGPAYGPPQQGGGVYGGPQQGGGNVYGAPQQGGGNVYGGQQGAGNVYGASQPQYGYEDPYYPQQQRPQPNYYPDYPDQGQGYGQQYR